MTSIKISNVSFIYETSSDYIFKNLNLDLDSQWKLGLVGRNGRGKTTFLNILRGKLKSSGSIITKASFTYFPIEIKDASNITFYELQEQMNFEEWKLEKELNLMGLDPEVLWQPYQSLSGGEQTKVLLALAFTQEDTLPLLDEPTNHLDEKSREEVAKYLKQQKSGFIVSSHDRSFLNKVTDHILAIENQEIHLYQGDYAAYEDTKEKRDKFNEAKNAKLKGKIKTLSESKERLKTFSARSENNKNAKAHDNEIHANINRGFMSHKAAKIMQRSKNVERRLNKGISEKGGLLSNIEKSDDLTINFQPDYHPEVLVVKRYTRNLDDRLLFSDLNFNIKNTGVTALIGKNGSGKSTLIRDILSNKVGIEIPQNVKISYLPQDFTIYQGTLASFAKEYKLNYSDLLNILRKLGFSRNIFERKIEEMSMGQQKRVAIAKSLLEPASLYLWDEPANYLDMFNQDQLIKILKEKQPAMLLIEHDQTFIDRVANQIIELS